MNSYEKVHEILRSQGMGLEFMTEMLERVYEVIREEYEHGVTNGYEKGWKDGHNQRDAWPEG